MSGMIEKVARAIAFSSGSTIVGPGQSRATREFGWDGDGGHFQKYVDAHWKNYEHAAQFAISAMRKPTPAMISAVNSHPDYYGYGDDSHEWIWGTMLEAALAEPEPKDIAA